MLIIHYTRWYFTTEYFIRIINYQRIINANVYFLITPYLARLRHARSSSLLIRMSPSGRTRCVISIRTHPRRRDDTQTRFMEPDSSGERRKEERRRTRIRIRGTNRR